MGDSAFQIGDRVVHLGEVWYRDYLQRTGTVIDVNPCGTSRYGNHGNMRTRQATKLKVRWDPLPCGRADDTAVSWVLAEWCRIAPTATSDEPFAVRDGEAVALHELPESRALVAAVAALESIPTDLLIAIQPFRVPEPPPAIEAIRAEEV
jgi:hypothetical protein